MRHPWLNVILAGRPGSKKYFKGAVMAEKDMTEKNAGILQRCFCRHCKRIPIQRETSRQGR